MITRILPQSEWDKLGPSGLPALLRQLKPSDIDVVVVEDGGKIVGTLGVLRMTHFEGVWIDPEKRNGYVLARLLHGAEQIVLERGETVVLGGAADDDEKMDGLIKRRGESRCR